jgi:hypothetical protein
MCKIVHHTDDCFYMFVTTFYFELCTNIKSLSLSLLLKRKKRIYKPVVIWRDSWVARRTQWWTQRTWRGQRRSRIVYNMLEKSKIKINLIYEHRLSYMFLEINDKLNILSKQCIVEWLFFFLPPIVTQKS